MSEGGRTDGSAPFDCPAHTRTDMLVHTHATANGSTIASVAEPGCDLRDGGGGRGRGGDGARGEGRRREEVRGWP